MRKPVLIGWSAPLPNPLPDEITIKGRDIIQYLTLKKQGYQTLWTGEGQICMAKPKRNTHGKI